jgi:hypothetical protein
MKPYLLALAVAGLATAPSLAQQLPMAGGTSGSAMSHLRCPQGQLLIGVRASMGERIDGVQAICGVLGANGYIAGRLALGGAAGRASAGQVQDLDCTPNGWVEGIELGPARPGASTSRIRLWCITSKGWKFAKGQIATPSRAPNRIVSHCASDRVVTGFRVRGAAGIEAVGVDCGPSPTFAAASAPAPAATYNAPQYPRPSSAPGRSLADQVLETQRRQNRENCAAAAQGRMRTCNY